MKKNTYRLPMLLLAVLLLCSACGSDVHMYKHKRADCDCPRFD